MHCFVLSPHLVENRILATARSATVRIEMDSKVDELNPSIYSIKYYVCEQQSPGL